MAQEYDGQTLRDDYGMIPSAEELATETFALAPKVRARVERSRERRATLAIAAIEDSAARDPNRARQFAQGAVVHGPRNLGSLLDLVNLGYGSSPDNPSHFNLLMQKLDPGSGGSFGAAGQRAGTRAWEAVVGPVREPRADDTVGRLAQAAGAGLTELPLAMATGGGTKALTGWRGAVELISAMGGEMGAELAGMASGDNPYAKLAGGLVGGVTPAVGYGMARRGPGAVVEAGETLGAAISPAARNRAGRRLAQVVVRDTVGEENMPRFLANLEREAAGETLAGTVASPGQVAMEFSPVAGKVEKAFAREGIEISLESGRKRAENARRMVDDFHQKWPDGAPEDAVTELNERLGVLGDEVTAAFEGVGHVADLPTERIAGKFMELMGDPKWARVARTQVPGEVLTELEKHMTDTATLDDLAGLSSLLSEESVKLTRAGSRTGANFIGKIQAEVEGILDEMAEIGGTEAKDILAFRRAKELRHLRGELMDPKRLRPGGKQYDNVVARAFAKDRDPIDALKTILTTGNPEESLSRLKFMLGEDSSGWRGVQHIVRDYVFTGGKRNPGTLSSVITEAITEGKTGPLKAAASALKSRPRLRAALRAVYGDEKAPHQMLRFIRRVKQLGSGVVGTSMEGMTAGSGLPKSAQSLIKRAQASESANAGVVVSVLTGQWRAAGAKMAGVIGRAQSAEEGARILDLAFRDNLVMRGLMEPMNARQIEYLGAHIRKALPSQTANVTRALAGPGVGALASSLQTLGVPNTGTPNARPPLMPPQMQLPQSNTPQQYPMQRQPAPPRPPQPPRRRQ